MTRRNPPWITAVQPHRALAADANASFGIGIGYASAAGAAFRPPIDAAGFSTPGDHLRRILETGSRYGVAGRPG